MTARFATLVLSGGGTKGAFQVGAEAVLRREGGFQWERIFNSPEILDAVWHSATMPVIWEPIGPRALVDGGLRNVTPLGDALDHQPTELVVLNCSPDQPDIAEAPRAVRSPLEAR